MRLTSVLSVALAVIRVSTLPGQATNPPYLSTLPSVDRVKQVMAVADPRESALRQMGALWQLQEIIKAISGSREFRGFLPDEGRLIGDYSTAAYRIGVAIDSAFPGPYGRWQHVSDNTPYRYSRSDPNFGVEGIDLFGTLVPPPVRILFLQALGVDASKHLARLRADSEAERRAVAGAQGAPQQGSKLAEEQRQIRRCAESGRSETECATEGIGKSFMSMVTDVMPGLKELLPKAPHGVRMGGDYPGAGGLRLVFYLERVAVGCGDLVIDLHDYDLVVGSGGVTITVANLPAPIVLSLRPNGQLAGPGVVEITGRVQVGTQMGVRTWSDGRTEPISRPVFEPRTRRCNLSLLAAAGPSPAELTLASMSAAMLDMFRANPDITPSKQLPAGMVMSGEYGSQDGVDIEFRAEGAVVGCRDATALRPYSVALEAGRVAVRIQNAAAPFTLILGPDGQLGGSGTIRVDGRAAVGSDGQGKLTYVPRSATCALGVMPPAK